MEELKRRVAETSIVSDLSAARVELDKEEKLSSLRGVLRGEEANAQELKARIRVLEEALDMQADQLGLKGQAELLAEVARLRGENESLLRDCKGKQAHADAAGALLERPVLASSTS